MIKTKWKEVVGVTVTVIMVAIDNGVGGVDDLDWRVSGGWGWWCACDS